MLNETPSEATTLPKQRKFAKKELVIGVALATLAALAVAANKRSQTAVAADEAPFDTEA